MGETATTRHTFGDLLRRVRPARRIRPSPKQLEPEATTEIVDKPTAYRTFSRKLAPGLTALGGLLAIAGGLGTWVRATRLVSEGAPIEEVSVTMGYESWPGVAIAVLGTLAFIASITWVMSALLLKIFPVIYALGIAVLVGWQMRAINDRAAGIADQAQSDLNFITFHAGYGWGVWCMLAGSVVLFLGITVGILREFDVRRGTS